MRKFVPKIMSAVSVVVTHAFKFHIGPFLLNLRGMFFTSPIGRSKCPVIPCILYFACSRIGFFCIFSVILSKNLLEIIVTEDPVSTRILLSTSSTKALQYVGPETSVSPYCIAPCEGLIELPLPLPSIGVADLFPVLEQICLGIFLVLPR